MRPKQRSVFVLGATLAALAGVVTAPIASAAGFTNWAVPTSVETVQGGVLIAGGFGTPHSCTNAGYVYVTSSNADMKQILALALAALAAGREVRFYIGGCASIGFYGMSVYESQPGHAAIMR